MIERVLQYAPTPGATPTDVTIRISAPRKVGEDWSVTLEIEGLPGAHRTEHHGVDSMSAVLSAARIAPVVLASIAGPGTLTWLGDSDLGFPFVPFGS
jgi:hypothetical protein